MKRKNKIVRMATPSIYILLGLTIFLLLRYIFYLIDDTFPSPLEKVLLPGFDDARIFIDHGYPEIKALGVQFLTLLSAILVFSITFSEKIINYNLSGFLVKMLLITAWCLFIAAIVFDGIGLSYNAYSLPVALTEVNQVSKNLPAFYEPAFTAIKIILFAGVCFVFGMVFIMAAAVISMLKK